MSDDTYSIKEVSDRVGWSRYTLRYYEKEGLLPGIARDENGYRVFTEDDIGFITILDHLRSTGMPISQMRAFVQTYRPDDPRGEAELVEERLRMLHAHREDVLSHLEALRGDLTAIERKIEIYEKRVVEEKQRHAETQTARS